MGVLPDTDLERVRRFCRRESPREFTDQLRVEFSVRGRSVTIFECRPPWQGGDGEWTRAPFAQLRYSPESTLWSLHWADRNSRWHHYDLVEPGPIQSLLAEIDHDPTCIFKG